MKQEIKEHSVDVVMIGVLIVIAVLFGIIGVIVWALIYGCYLLFKGAFNLKGEKRGFIKTDILLITIFVMITVACVVAYFFGWL